MASQARCPWRPACCIGTRKNKATSNPETTRGSSLEMAMVLGIRAVLLELAVLSEF